VIGLYRGAEDNVFWRRRAGDDQRIEADGARALRPGDVASLPADVIHSVANPIDGLSAALHVYGGDLYAQERSEWDALLLTEKPHDKAFAKAAFERANAAMEAAGP
jgi:predicted metal-dependent enzyme (double-stranded beta helix superfamily)